MYTNQVATYSLNWNNAIGSLFNLGIGYSGIKQDQYNGTCTVIDSLRINQIAHTLSVTPSISFQKKYDHTISLNCNFVQNKTLNKLYFAGINVMTLTVGALYALDFTPVRFGFDVGYDFSMSSSQYANYHSHGVNLGLRYKIMKKEKLNRTVTYNGSMAYNIQKDEGVDNDISVSNSIGSNFTYNNAHTASLYLSLSNYSDRVIIGQRVQTDLDCRFTLSYSYAFSAPIKTRNKTERQAHRLNKKSEKTQSSN